MAYVYYNERQKKWKVKARDDNMLDNYTLPLGQTFMLRKEFLSFHGYNYLSNDKSWGILSNIMFVVFGETANSYQCQITGYK